MWYPADTGAMMSVLPTASRWCRVNPPPSAPPYMTWLWPHMHPLQHMARGSSPWTPGFPQCYSGPSSLQRFRPLYSVTTSSCTTTNCPWILSGTDSATPLLGHTSKGICLLTVQPTSPALRQMHLLPTSSRSFGTSWNSFGVYHHTETMGPPVFFWHHRLPPSQLEAAKMEFDKMLVEGLIRHLNSPWVM